MVSRYSELSKATPVCTNHLQQGNQQSSGSGGPNQGGDDKDAKDKKVKAVGDDIPKVQVRLI
jgi:hypothetical protein